ncbi:MAG TPA: MFS transporter [Acidobacteriota bacterium]|nr:MFS transporter [Acidobacteriota bacterium]
MKKRILISASFFHALTDAASVITPTIFPILYSRGFLITSYSQIGLLSNLGLIATFLVQFLVVRISYKHEYRTLLLASGLAICATMALVPFARTFAVLLLLFLLLRISTSFYHPIMIAWISKTRAGSGKELDDAMGIQSGSGNLGVILAYLTVGFMAQRWTWKTPLFVWSLFGLVLGAVGIVVLRGISSKAEARPSLSPSSWARSLRGIKRYIPGFFFGGMGWSVTVYYAPSLLNHRFGVPMGRTGLFLALWIGMGTITGYGYGVWSRRFGRKFVFLLSLGGATVSLFLIGFARHQALAVAGLVAFGGFLLMTYPSLHTFVGSTVPEREQTQAFSWVSNIQLLSGAIVSLVAGFLSDAVGIQFPFVLTGALTLGVFLFYLPRGPEFFGGKFRDTIPISDL